jgi:(R,R)-butanediol dehydrogenase/meso-butanediol dehydrogenase/diacetyl reductase
MQTSAVPAALMPAVRWHGRRDVRVEDVPVPGPPGSGEIRVEVAWCGLCGSDLHEYLAGPQSIPTRPHPVTGRCAPIVLGHEVSGWVTETGPAVSGLAAGDLVALNALLPCGRCGPCGDGAVHLCRVLGHIGMSADGGLASYLTVPAGMAVRVPDGVAPDLAALAEPLAVALHALRLGASSPPHASPALVLGAGAIGLCVALALRARGVDVTVIDVAAGRLELARELGLATAVSGAGAGGFGAGAGDFGPDGAPVVYECSGAVAAAARAPLLVAPGGTVVFAGLPQAAVPVDMADVVLREIRLVGSMSHLRDADLVPAVAFLAAHGESLRELVTARIPLRDTVPRGLEVLTGPERGRHVKILVKVGG